MTCKKINIIKKLNKKSNKNYKKRFDQYEFCLICSVKMSGPIDYQKHMESKSHQKKYKQQIKKEIASSGSFRNFLIKKDFITSRKCRLNRLRYYLYLNSIREILRK